MKNLVRIHIDMRPEALQETRISEEIVKAMSWGGGELTEFRILGFIVRLVGWLRFVWSAATGRVRGALVLDVDDGLRRQPRVLLDWETYSSLLLMAEPQRIPDVTECSADAVEMGGSFT